MRDYKQPFGALMRVPDVQEAGSWLCENLFFVQAQEGVFYNGNCVLYLEQGATCALPPPTQGQYYTGLAHVAMAAADIDKALAHCKARGLSLQTQGGKSFYNPKVFGGGEWYFNIQTPFGAVIEVAQRQETHIEGATPICGLDHLGVPCIDYASEAQYLEKHGFTPLFDPVHNYNQSEGNIVCCMLSDANLTLEVYQFLDMIPYSQPNDAVLQGIYCYCPAETPGGLHFLRKGENA